MLVYILNWDFKYRVTVRIFCVDVLGGFKFRLELVEMKGSGVFFECFLFSVDVGGSFGRVGGVSLKKGMVGRREDSLGVVGVVCGEIIFINMKVVFYWNFDFY